MWGTLVCWNEIGLFHKDCIWKDSASLTRVSNVEKSAAYWTCDMSFSSLLYIKTGWFAPWKDIFSATQFHPFLVSKSSIMPLTSNLTLTLSRYIHRFRTFIEAIQLSWFLYISYKNMQPQVRLKTTLNYSNWECCNSYPCCRIWGWASATKADNIILIIFYIYLYTLLRIWFWCQCDHTILKVTDPNGISAKMIKNTISRQVSDRSSTRCLSSGFCSPRLPLASFKKRSAVKLTGTSAQAEEFSVFSCFFSSYILWFTPLIELCTI